MKKLLKLCLCLLFVISLAACGGKASNAEQEKVVSDFLQSLKLGDIDKMSQLCTSDSADTQTFMAVLDTFKPLTDANIYGETFAQETEKYMKEFFNKMVVSYDIKETKKVEEHYEVKADVVLKSVDNSSISTTNMEQLTKSYQNAHLSELQKIYKEQGEDAVRKAIFSGIAVDFFKEISKTIEKAEATKTELTFTLVLKDGKWLISKTDAK